MNAFPSLKNKTPIYFLLLHLGVLLIPQLVGGNLSFSGRKSWPQTWRCWLSSHLLHCTLQTAPVPAGQTEEASRTTSESRDAFLCFPNWLLLSQWLCLEFLALSNTHWKSGCLTWYTKELFHCSTNRIESVLVLLNPFLDSLLEHPLQHSAITLPRQDEQCDIPVSGAHPPVPIAENVSHHPIVPFKDTVPIHVTLKMHVNQENQDSPAMYRTFRISWWISSRPGEIENMVKPNTPPFPWLSANTGQSGPSN